MKAEPARVVDQVAAYKDMHTRGGTDYFTDPVRRARSLYAFAVTLVCPSPCRRLALLVSRLEDGLGFDRRICVVRPLGTSPIVYADDGDHHT